MRVESPPALSRRLALAFCTDFRTVVRISPLFSAGEPRPLLFGVALSGFGNYCHLLVMHISRCSMPLIDTAMSRQPPLSLIAMQRQNLMLRTLSNVGGRDFDTRVSIQTLCSAHVGADRGSKSMQPPIERSQAKKPAPSQRTSSSTGTSSRQEQHSKQQQDPLLSEDVEEDWEEEDKEDEDSDLGELISGNEAEQLLFGDKDFSIGDL